MTNLNESWWFNHDNNAQTNRAINEFSASTMAAQARLRSSIAAQGKETKNLAERLARVERAVLAVVALEDAREQLEPYRAEQRTRQFARGVLSGRADRDVDGDVSDDVAGYWLAPAARAVASWSRGGDGGADAAEARRRDPERGELFLTVASGLAGREISVPSALLPPVAGEVTPTQRSLWEAAAAGRFGPAGRTALVDRLREVVAAADAAEVRTTLQARLPIRTRATAADRLDALRAWLATIGDAAAPADRADPADGGSGDALAAIIARLVDEGSEPERALLEASANARAAIGALTTDGANSSPRREVAPRPALNWLIADLDGSAAAPAPLRALAAEVLAPAIDEIAQAMADAATAPPESPPARLAAATPEPADPRAVADTLRASARRSQTLSLIGAAIGVLGVILGLLVAPGWFALGALGALAPAVLWYSSVRTNRRADRLESSPPPSATTTEAHAAGRASVDETARADQLLAAVRTELERFAAPVTPPPTPAAQDSAVSGAT